MSNYENIKPYADFAHTAAKHGGVDSYLNELETASYDAGATDARNTDMLLIPVILAGGAIIWEGGKWILKKCQHYLENRKNEDIKKIEAAKKAIKDGVNASEKKESTIDESSSDNILNQT